MLDQYYGIMGWDVATGNPTLAKLMELGLEWAM
jgi:aldehyde:ferredoxin oxidoreductase